MKVQINTDGNIDGQETLSTWIRDTVESAVEYNAAQITRVEVHLSDLDSHKSSHIDKRCMMEARLKGRQPLAISHKAGSVEDAVDGAAQKLARLVENTISRARDMEEQRIDPAPAERLESESTAAQAHDEQRPVKD